MLDLAKRITDSPSQPLGGAMASLGLTARMHLGNPSFTGTPTHEGGGCPGQPLGHPEAEPLASHAWEGVVHLPMVSEQLEF